MNHLRLFFLIMLTSMELYAQTDATVFFIRDSENSAIDLRKSDNGRVKTKGGADGSADAVMNIMHNKKKLCKYLQKGKYKTLEITPGTYDFSAKGQMGKAKTAISGLELKSGETYYLQLITKTSLMSIKSELILLSQEEADVLLSRIPKAKKGCDKGMF